MKRIAVLAAVFIGALAFSAWSADPFVVGIEQSTKDAWQNLATQFEASTGIPVTTQPITQSSIAQQVVLQAFTKSGKLHFVMLQTAWTSNLARYLVDLAEIDAQLRAEGVIPVVVDGRTLGVPISFANGWFLAVVAWPADRASATQFLIAAARGGSTTATVAPKSTGPTSIPRASSLWPSTTRRSTEPSRVCSRPLNQRSATRRSPPSRRSPPPRRWRSARWRRRSASPSPPTPPR
jgi:hypothetical protein